MDTIQLILIALLVLALGATAYLLLRIRRITRLIRSHRKDTNLPFSGGPLQSLESEIGAWIAERKKEAERLEALETYRKEYLGNVSHELKTPIFNIQGYIHTLVDGGLEDRNINLSYLKKAGSNVDRMIAILEDLQTITQFERGELELDREDFDIMSLIDEVIDSQEISAKKHNIWMTLMNTPGEQIVYADKFRIRQVIVNLVENSIRYGKPNGETRIRVSDIGEKVRVEVSDNGIGIAKEHLPRIFERFYRADKSRSREQGGTGLGLSIVKHILEVHGESIDVISTPGAGSVFSFTLQKGSQKAD